MKKYLKNLKTDVMNFKLNQKQNQIKKKKKKLGSFK